MSCYQLLEFVKKEVWNETCGWKGKGERTIKFEKVFLSSLILVEVAYCSEYQHPVYVLGGLSKNHIAGGKFSRYFPQIGGSFTFLSSHRIAYLTIQSRDDLQMRNFLCNSLIIFGTFCISTKLRKFNWTMPRPPYQRKILLREGSLLNTFSCIFVPFPPNPKTRIESGIDARFNLHPDQIHKTKVQPPFYSAFKIKKLGIVLFQKCCSFVLDSDSLAGNFQRCRSWQDFKSQILKQRNPNLLLLSLQILGFKKWFVIVFELFMLPDCLEKCARV